MGLYSGKFQRLTPANKIGGDHDKDNNDCSRYLLNTSHVSDTVLSDLHILYRFIFLTIPTCYPYYTDEKTEAQRS